ncbi:hypothetical protein NQ315_013464 [Exocentrus adspersus]|uniref:Uncharacterized protein n=1 Tax=Exocentrus adspersus TaxID=1586481 RepID=A0AAV8VE45_9CUCU|nr:hypothetical protein NQ315_013464 [Exocentrus adspersus]
MKTRYDLEPIPVDFKLVRRFGCIIRRGPKKSHQSYRSHGRDPTSSHGQSIVFCSHVKAVIYSDDLHHSPTARDVNLILVNNSHHYMLIE